MTEDNSASTKDALTLYRIGHKSGLLRSGEVAMAFIDGRENTAEWSDDRIFYHFRTAGGADVSGRAFYVGYNVPEGSIIPVFYDANNPRDHVVACVSWFEAD